MPALIVKASARLWTLTGSDVVAQGLDHFLALRGIARQKNHEFVSAAPRRDAAFVACGIEDPAAQCAQHGVACGVPVAVVDLLEEVDVHRDGGERLPGPDRFGKARHFAKLQQVLLVDEPGEARRVRLPSGSGGGRARCGAAAGAAVRTKRSGRPRR